MKDSSDAGFVSVLKRRGLHGLEFRRRDWLQGVIAAYHEPTSTQLAVTGLMYGNLLEGRGCLPLRERASLAWMAYRDVISGGAFVRPYTVGSDLAFDDGVRWALSIGITSKELRDPGFSSALILADAMSDDGRSFASEVVLTVAGTRRETAAGLLSDILI
ncbi:hypothetical protein BISA_1351 [Bifidobacterium saguini DSM 23967]|uniref:Uncharacterized protein n=1 Tax=Bifidobacterium saguini DSM 23967 TaxID=1437607 RepID=A0A087DCD6_9BIFI|nr:hypothetical protein [Bifidobacterium saguini]KFI93186.1 hypothetical protein BISA_1351 [Bifidobacterium saguini DSM 23967]